MKKKSKKELKQLLNSYKDAVDLNILCSIANKEGNITYVNKKFCEISQYTKEELIGQNHRIINSGFHTTSFFKEMWDTISNGEIWQGDVRSKAKDGSFFWVHSVIIPVFDDNKKIKEYFSLRLPIDEKIRREEDKLKQIELLEEMLFIVSHRVKQPIANIIGLSSLLDDSIESKEDVAKLISHIKTSIITLDLFANELTHFLENRKEEDKNKLLEINKTS